MRIRMKEVIRLIASTKVYFFTIALVTCFGVLVYTGISFSTASLVQSCEDYFNDNQFYDMQVGSLYGFKDKDLKKIKSNPDVSKAEAIYYSQELIDIDSNDYVAEFYSKAKTLNSEKIRSGRLPEKKDECMIEQALADRFGISIGDKIKLSKKSDYMSAEEFTVVGTAELVTVFSKNDFYNRGTSDLGDGQVTTRVMVAEKAFVDDFVKQVCYITLKNRGVRGSDAYDKKVEKLKKELMPQIKAIGENNRNKKKNEMQEKLDEKTDEYDSAKAKLDNAKSQIAKAEREIPAKKKELSQKQSQLKAAEKKLPELKSLVDQAEDAYAQVKPEYDSAQANANNIKAKMDSAKSEEARAQLEQEYYSALNTYRVAKAKYDAASSARSQANSAYSSAKSKIKDGKKALSSGKSQIASAESQLKSAKQQVKTKEPELAEAKEKLEDAEKQIKKIPKSQVYTSNINDNSSYTNYSDSIEMTDTIVFTLCALLMAIAVLVCITTVGRMVTEQHRNIGTMKAQGFRNREIRNKYIVYVVIATFVGIVVAAAASYLFFEKWIYTIVYGESFIVRGFKAIIDWKAMALIFVIQSVIMSICATIACRQMLSKNTIDLLNSNIRNSKFTSQKLKRCSNELKMVLRNLKSNPQILLTSIVSVAGCTIIMICALSVYSGMSGISDLQFRQLQHYQGTMTIDSDASKEDREELINLINSSDEIEALPVFERFIPFETSEEKKYASMIGINREDNYRDYLEIKDASSGKQLSVPEEGVLICKRIAEEFNYSKGDEIILADNVGKEYKTTIKGIFDRYIGLAMIADSDYYSKLKDEDVIQNQYYIKGDKQAIKDFVKSVSDHKAFCNYSDAAYFEAEMNFRVRCVTMVIMIILVVTGLLSIVVIFDLVQMNIQQKEKDIVVMKVLGYPTKKIYGYVFWESMAMCICGLIVGILAGGPLGSYMILIEEMENLQYVRGISVFACAAGGLVNLIFCIVSNLIALRGVRKIKMVGSAREA